ncbi:MAG: CheR family methyltransferase [Gammaproteobacteria bacterium]|nr:CheR family methyltransferase [Gammaproteobacteria bacterium]
MNDAALLDELAQLTVLRNGLRIRGDARDRFANILRERAAHLGYSSLQDYRTFLVGKLAAEEWEELTRIFTSGETFFFRDHGQFDLMRLHLLPELIAVHRSDKILRLWSAGCASGEEVYSLAMLMDMLLPLPQHGGWDIRIFGTDIDSAAIAKARRGRYGKWSFRMIPPALQQRYFHLEGNEWILDERIRSMVTLRVSNLVDEPFPDSASELHDMDLILCRNVFIYFDPAAVSAVAAKLAATLHEGGYLLTAHTELIGHTVQGLESRLFADGVGYKRVSYQSVIAPPASPPSISVAAGAWRAPLVARSSVSIANKASSATVQTAHPAPMAPSDEALLKEARVHADCGAFDKAEQMCHKALVANPLASAPYFLLAQLAQIKGDFELAKECLDKAIYLDPRFVAAYLELAALCERVGNMARAQTLRCAALDIIRTMQNDEVIEQYETTVGDLVKWLAQCEREPAEVHPKELKS